MQGTRAFFTTLPDGHINYIWHQSALNDADLCLERLRRGISGEMPQVENDAAAAGTALHSGLEANVENYMEHGKWLNPHDTLELSLLAFENIVDLDNFQWVKYESINQIDALLTKAVASFHREVAPKLHPVASEVKFGPFTIYEDDKRVIQIEGTIDYIDQFLGLCDWKTGSTFSWKGKGWEKARWAIQPTAYTLGHLMIEGNTFDTVLRLAGESTVPFTFIVFRDDGQVQWETVQRTAGDWRWLVEKSVSLCKLVEADLDAWPLNDQHALCSEKWCPAWGDCKGKFVDAGWPYHRD